LKTYFEDSTLEFEYFKAYCCGKSFCWFAKV